MKRNKFLLIIAMQFIVIRGLACTCLDVQPDIITGINTLMNFNAFSTTVTIEGKIIGQGNIGSKPSLTVEVINTFYGNTTNDTISIVGSDGADCFFTIPYTINDRLICTISEYANGDIYGPVPCGFYYVKIVGNTVYSPVAGTFAFGGYPYNSFIDTLTQTISGFVSNTEPSISMVSIYPNPVQQSLLVEMGDLPAKIVFYDSHGAQVLEQVITDKHTKIDMEKFSLGTYLYCIERKRLIIEKGKIIKMN